MTDKPKYSWQAIFDAVKEADGEIVLAQIKARHKFIEPSTPRTLRGYCNFYAKYNSDSDAVMLWAYTDKTQEFRDQHDSYWGMETCREKCVGLRNRAGDWITPLASEWE